MGRWVDWCAQRAANLVASDRCHLCDGRRPAPSQLSAPEAFIAGTVGVRLAGIATVSNRPICSYCASRLDSGPPRPRGIPLESDPEVAVLAPFVTNDALLDVIHLLKFARVSSVASLLGRAMAATLQESEVGPVHALVPVPMDRRSRWRRGFNQAQRLAAAVAAESGIEVAPGVLAKVRRTRPQSMTPPSERVSNVSGAFGPGSDPYVRGSVVLVDDLVTTGATAAACAAVLRLAGAGSVFVLAAGRGRS